MARCALLRLPAERDDLAAIAEAAARLAPARPTSSSSAPAGRASAARPWRSLPAMPCRASALSRGPRLHFMDNLDPETLRRAARALPLATTRFVAISKSGGTGETLMQTIAALTRAQGRPGSRRIPDLFLGLTEPAKAGKRNGLRDCSTRTSVPMLDHDPGVGGRYSVLTNVGLLPAAVVGLDIGAIRAGAADALAPVLDGSRPPRCRRRSAPRSGRARRDQGKTISVLMAYADRLERFTRWYVQLWAESLGKDGKGTTPLGALGPVDQHSQLQLFIAGPARQAVHHRHRRHAPGAGRASTPSSATARWRAGLAGKTIGDLVAAQGRATAETLAKNGCPVRTIHLERARRASLGELLMHFMLETIIAAHLLGVDPFDQPAVEEGKVLAKQYLAQSACRRSSADAMIRITDTHRHRRARDRGELHPRVRAGRAERQQARDRGAAALRRAALAVAAQRRERAAEAARRQQAHQRRRAGHHGAAPPHPGAQPRGRARPADRADPRGRGRADEAPADQADQGRQARTARAEEAPLQHQGLAPGKPSLD